MNNSGLEKELVATTKIHDLTSFNLLKSIPGVGKIPALTFLYEIHDIGRFRRVQAFLPTRPTHHRNTLLGDLRAGSVFLVSLRYLRWARVRACSSQRIRMAIRAAEAAQPSTRLGARQDGARAQGLGRIA